MTAFPAISRPQSPIESITAEQYEEMIEVLDFYALADDSNDGNCGIGGCPIK